MRWIAWLASWFVFLTIWTALLVVATSPVFVPVLVWAYEGASAGLQVAAGYAFVLLFFGAVWVSNAR